MAPGEAPNSSLDGRENLAEEAKKTAEKLNQVFAENAQIDEDFLDYLAKNGNEDELQILHRFVAITPDELSDDEIMTLGEIDDLTLGFRSGNRPPETDSGGVSPSELRGDAIDQLNKKDFWTEDEAAASGLMEWTDTDGWYPIEGYAWALPGEDSENWKIVPLEESPEWDTPVDDLKGSPIETTTEESPRFGIPIEEDDGLGSLDLNQDGVIDFMQPKPTLLDQNADGLYDMYQPEISGDDDGDGIADPVDTFSNAYIQTDKPLGADIDDNGVPDSIQAPETAFDTSDADNDGVPDYLQSPDAVSWDANGDGIPDSIQAPETAFDTSDADNDGVPDYLQSPDAVSWDANGDGIPDSIQAPAEDTEDESSAPAAITAPKEANVQPAEATASGPREAFDPKDHVEWNAAKTEFVIKGMSPSEVQKSRITDFFGPTGAMSTESPDQYILTSGGIDHRWNSTHATWIIEGKTSYKDRLKVFNNTVVQVAKVPTEPPAVVEEPPKDDPAPAEQDKPAPEVVEKELSWTEHTHRTTAILGRLFDAGGDKGTSHEQIKRQLEQKYDGADAFKINELTLVDSQIRLSISAHTANGGEVKNYTHSVQAVSQEGQAVDLTEMSTEGIKAIFKSKENQRAINQLHQWLRADHPTGDELDEAPEEPEEDEPEMVEKPDRSLDLRGYRKTNIYKEVENLSVPPIDAPRNAWMESSSRFPETGHVYKQYVGKSGHVTRRAVQMEDGGQWYEIPYLKQAEENIRWKYNQNGDERGQYLPDRKEEAWKGRHKYGALTLQPIDAPE